MSILLISAAYLVYAAFWARFFSHAIVWWRAARRLEGPSASGRRISPRACGRAAMDSLLFARLFMVNPALWLGEWLFHAAFALVLARHMRYILDPVPSWVWGLQTPGRIAGYVLPCSLLYILFIRLFTKHERYAAPANVFLLVLVLLISSMGLLMRWTDLPDMLQAKAFILGILSFRPVVAPENLLFMAHFVLVLVLIPFLPTHIVTAPFVMMEARRREQALKKVLHES